MARKSDDTTKRPGERVAKVMARAGLGSRREAEQWIAAGRVAVNGEIVTTPAVNVTARDKVTVDGKPLPTRERTRLFLYHKPRGLITARTDPQGRPTIFDALPDTLPRLLSVGRLDLNTEGLLLLTNDGGLARVLELPETGWLRRYRVRAHGRVTQAQLDGLRNGVEVDGIQYGPIEATLDREQASNVWLTFAIREGKNREVRNVLGHLGLKVARLIRVSYGPFQLGDLPEGAVEEVPTRILRDQLGERIARRAGADLTAPIIAREGTAQSRQARSNEEPSPRAVRDKWPERPAGAERAPRAASDGRHDRRGRPDREARTPRKRADHRSSGNRAEERETRWNRNARPREDRRAARAFVGRGERPSRGPREEPREPRGKPRWSRNERSRDDRRAGRAFADRDERRMRGDRARDASAKRDARPAAKKTKKSDYAWREDGGMVRRKYHGAARHSAPEAEESPRSKRAGLLKDRKGRRILVERVGDQAPTGPATGRPGPARPRGRSPGPRRPRTR